MTIFFHGGKMRNRNVSFCGLSLIFCALLYLISEYNHSKQKIQPHGHEMPITFVLVVGYTMSAISWSREVLSYARECFYVSEPLQGLLTDDGFYKKNLIAYNNNTFRRPNTPAEHQEHVMMTLYRIFTCQFSLLLPDYKNLLVHDILEMYKEREIFEQCLTDAKKSTSSKCINELENFCRSKSHHLIMTTKLSMDIVNDMLELWPSLKVVSILQDPRNVANMYQKGGGIFGTDYNSVADSRELCTRVYEDLQLARSLEQGYTGRLKIVSLEAIVESPFSATGSLYEFLDMFLYTEKVWFWVYSNIQKMVKEQFYKIIPSKTLTKSSVRWSKDMNLETIGIIDQFCKIIYDTQVFGDKRHSSEL